MQLTAACLSVRLLLYLLRIFLRSAEPVDGSALPRKISKFECHSASSLIKSLAALVRDTCFVIDFLRALLLVAAFVQSPCVISRVFLLAAPRHRSAGQGPSSVHRSCRARRSRRYCRFDNELANQRPGNPSLCSSPVSFPRRYDKDRKRHGGRCYGPCSTGGERQTARCLQAIVEVW